MKESVVKNSCVSKRKSHARRRNKKRIVSERKLLEVAAQSQGQHVRKQRKKQRKLEGVVRAAEVAPVQPLRVKYKKHTNYYVNYSYQKHSSFSAENRFHS